ncbi:MAG: EAL domain-containing protein [Gammaproteobacteria bacterium]|nr:EAL domain-containing protein [Gammaproteobacteria bacterium]
MKIETNLRHALEKNEFHLVYQPQIRVSDKSIIGAEALLRWQNDRLGFVPPDQFISIAEETGMILPIGEWVLRAACKQFMRWRKTGILLQQLAVNVSLKQVKQPGFSETVSAILLDTGMPPKNLELEITESLLADDTSQVSATLSTLRDMGVKIAIDDFGAGYSSFAYLALFPINILKIDKSFMDKIATNSNSTAIVKGIIAMAHALNLKTTAEGIETDIQLQFINHLDCEYAQGYLISKPLPAEEFEEFLRKSKIQHHGHIQRAMK